MSNDLVVSGGGALTVPATGGGVGEHVGDMSVDRGAPPTTAGNEPPIIRDLQRAVGFAIAPTQIAKAHEVLKRHRLWEDQRQRVAAEAAIKARWGVATEGNLVKIHGWLLDTMGKELADEILGARDGDGTGICNKPAVLEAMLKAAQATPVTSKDGNDPNAARHARAREIRHATYERVREIESWMGAPKGSAQWKRYYDDPEVQAEYRAFAEDEDAATPRHTADADVKDRIAELEGWMGARPGSADYKRYWNDPQIQEEYLQLQRRRQ